jgi:predicted NAD-dependent protein-ADP-ribosyltransferase YbiA (DUF1768 family)
MPTVITEEAFNTKRPKPIYFSKPSFKNGYLSQWYSSEFTHNNDTYATVEQWMMVCKARAFHDDVGALSKAYTLNLIAMVGYGRQNSRRTQPQEES